jgi:glycosyltransferase involved in cell wall biosynthesis
LPVVSFDFPATRSLLPRGTVRVPFRDGKAFGQAVLKLLDDPHLYAQTKADALGLAAQWDWDARAKRTLEFFEEALRRG